MKKIIKFLLNKIKSLALELKSNAGVTLIEMIITITIVAILAIVVGPMLFNLPNKAKVSAAKQQIQNFGLALNMYSLDNGFYPTTEQGLNALVKKPDSEPVPLNYNESGYMKNIPKDPWGKDFVYISPGEDGSDYRIICYGADGQEGGEDKNADIKSGE